ncbi:MAG TPA: YkgJ family cysteine cluster protein [Polyangiales bacterium]|jgi:Fe-S-cluster containining protein|nr:YkgJ family cysteine cluster protein [Polyangiales bacterium]
MSKPSRKSKTQRKTVPPVPPVPAARRPVPCLSCALCCSYVAIEIDAPNSLKRATMLLWYLYHENISLYECDGEWTVQFETRCKNLGQDRRCGVYETRPHICREYSEKDCEVNSEDVGRTFYTPEQLREFLREKRPKLYAKLEKGFLPPLPPPSEKRASRRLPVFEQRFRELRAMGVS